MTLGHVGLGIAIVGMTGTLWKGEAIEALARGQSIALAGYTVTLDRIEPVAGPNYTADRAILVVTRDGRPITELRPERRHFLAPEMTVADTAIRTTGIADLYVALGDPDPNGRWVVRLYHNTGAPLIWGGAIVMALGGLVSLADRRFRLGVPQRRRTEAGTAPATPA
jgi:cytochrome c-type biogenesis protein CcmF